VADRDTLLRISPSAASGKAGSVKGGTPLKLLENKGDWRRVRTFSGDEGWLQTSIVRPR
jgi:SH3-like domain-containing protein